MSTKTAQGGTATRRCSCRNPETGKNWGSTCPKLSNRRHGTWSIRHELVNRPDGTRREFRRSGFASSTDATKELAKVRALLAIPDEDDPEGLLAVSDMLEQCAAGKDVLPDYDTTRERLKAGQPLNARTLVAEWLDEWLGGKKSLRVGGYKRYEVDIRVHLKPHLGEIRLDKLTVQHLNRMFDAINERNIEIQEQNTQRRAALAELKEIPWKGAENRARRNAMKAAIAEMPPFRRGTSVNTQHHIRDTLRAALNVAIGQRILPSGYNAAEHVELLPGTKPKALLWTDERIAEWKRTGVRPSPVMVWTPEQLGTFLDHILGHRLEAMWRLLAFRGVRRGEGCAPRWTDFSAKNRSLTIATQLVQDGWDVHEGLPKTNSGIRVVALDTETVESVEARRVIQDAEKAKWGTAWQDTGRIFTEEDGSLLHPGKISDLFDRLVAEAGLPPIRLHDLRHGAATLMLAADVDIKVVSETLGHSDTRITRDIYQSVLDDLAREAAEAVVKLVPRAPSAIRSVIGQRAARAATAIGASLRCSCECSCGAGAQGKSPA
ncbi:tyrosine-type recombinase/integrase [Streptomyces jumonjinensis]|uniref:Site-specific integrase n=1 Tax=Streptomyces jumonjinensis TaxID=1945 RepID=A0A646KRX7_STRJU|nr:site-specific integrase [Streptomyces jumonjinensis]MQT04828.1 site-specific integrase [Streptomyces jumonjinensis]